MQQSISQHNELIIHSPLKVPIKKIKSNETFPTSLSVNKNHKKAIFNVLPHDKIIDSISRIQSMKEIIVPPYKKNHLRNISNPLTTRYSSSYQIKNTKSVCSQFLSDIEKVKSFTLTTLALFKKNEKRVAKIAKIFPYQRRNKFKDQNTELKYVEETQNKTHRMLSYDDCKKSKRTKQKSAFSKVKTSANTSRTKYIENPRERILFLTEKEIHKLSFNLYNLPTFLKDSSRISYNDINMQMAILVDKATLIIDNISFFKSNYMYSNQFIKAFSTLEEEQKYTYNKAIEEICALLLILPKLLITPFYESLDQILYCEIPNLTEEKNKSFKDEEECLQLNYMLFINVTNYFIGCFEIFKVIKRKIISFRYERENYHKINRILDIVRYNTSTLINFAKTYINRIKEDEDLLKKMEENLMFRKKEIIKEKKDFLDRFKLKEKNRISEEALKNIRISNALDMKKKFDDKNFLEKNKGMVNVSKQLSVLNLALLTDIMKYIPKTIREKIIAQRVVERYKDNEIKDLRLMESNKVKK